MVKKRGNPSDLLLAVDVGNSNTVLGLFEGGDLVAHWRLTTRR
jgi:type III pantothenate kinase